MATPRLTNNLRRHILTDVIKHAFQQKLDDMIMEEIQLAHDIFDSVYADDIELLASSKPHLFGKASTFNLFLDSNRHTLCFAGPSFNTYSIYQLLIGFKSLEKAARSVPYSARSGSPIAQFTSSSKFGRRLAKAEHISDQFVETVRNAVSSANAILDSTSSFNKLIKAWPEIESFAKPYMDQSKTNLPAVQTTALNAMLDIPV